MAPKVVIVGAGVGGMIMAIALQRELGFFDYIIVEKADDVGGTWRANTYPGCTSDTSVHFYSLSTEPKADWNHRYAYQPDLLEYWRNIAAKHGLFERTQFNTRVISASWDPAAQEYLLVLENISTGQTRTQTCKVLISATGVLEYPRLPGIPGKQTFKGASFHSAKWDKSVELKGKRVVVIGNGSSATQLVPKISVDPTVTVKQFARTPHWLVPARQANISSFRKWTFRWIPGWTFLNRCLYHFRADFFYYLGWANRRQQPLLMWFFTRYIKNNAPEKYQYMLIPKYMVGCKRAVFDSGYLAALHRPNLTLSYTHIAHIEEDGIVTVDGDKHPCDVIVYATGFVTDEFSFDVRGTKETIREYYDASGGPTAYKGTSIPGFPNMFLLGGPNTVTGHTSVIQFEEVQANMIVQLVQPLLSGTLSTLEVTPEATSHYNQKIQRRVHWGVLADCTSWYRRGGTGKVTSVFPGPGTLFWLWLRKVSWGDYRGIPKEKMGELKRRQRRMDILRKAILLLGLIGGAMWLKPSASRRVVYNMTRLIARWV